MRHVELDAVEPGRDRAPASLGERVEQLLDLVLLELLGHRRVRVLARGYLARGDEVPVGVVVVGRVLLQHRRRAETHVEELGRQLASVAVHGLGDLREALDLLVVPEAGKVELRVERLAVDDRAADDDEPAGGLGPFLVVGDGLVGEHPLERVGDPGRARRREHDPVRDRRVADRPFREEARIRAHGGSFLVCAPRIGLGSGPIKEESQ